MHGLLNIAILVLLVLQCFISNAQQTDSTEGSFAINVQLHSGFLAQHKPTMIALVTGHTTGVELNAIKCLDGNKPWQKAYHLPDVGLSYCMFDVGNRTTIGNAHAVYPFINFRVIDKKYLDVNLRVGWGLGIIERPFNRYKNYKNFAIGSYLNGVMAIRADFQWTICNNSKILAGWGLTHWSNASTATPNLGINITTVSLGYQHTFGKKHLINNQPALSFGTRWRKSFYAASFFKEIYPADGKKYFVSTFSVNASKSVSAKNNWGLGMDVFYNASIIESLKRSGQTTKPFDSWRIGVHGNYMLTIDACDLVFENGVYVLGQLDDDPFLYTRLGIRYHFTKHWFACGNLKTHFAKADFFETGLGYEW
jgi:hypothetical protein